jgi:scyllo-inositol 2-dehydrogenase (NADP+)
MLQSNLRTIRAGIIGAGWVASARHAPAICSAPGTQLVGVFDRNPDAARKLAAAHDAPIATDSLEQLLQADLDFVSICTPPFAHLDTASQAMRAGADVFLEKPMAMSLHEAQELASIASDQRRILSVSHNFLFSRSMRHVRSELRSGRTGAIRQVIAFQASSPRRRLPAWYGELPLGLFFDESPHLLYILGNLLGDLRVAYAQADLWPEGGPQPVRSLQAIFNSPTAPAVLTMTFDSPVSEWHVLILCEKEILAVDLFRDISVVVPSDGQHRALDILRTSATATFAHARGFARSGMELVQGRQDWGHGRLIRSFIRAVRDRGPAPVPIHDSLRVVALTDEILHFVARA